jgi:hypothetical protein
MITPEWTIQARAHECAVTARAFAEGEHIYALLFDEPAGYRREDLSEEAFKARSSEAPQPFSFWRMKYTLLHRRAGAPRQAKRGGAAPPLHGRSRARARERPLPLAVMLERKRILKEIETRRGDDGKLTRIYEHPKSGEVFVIPDPELRLDQLEAVQAQMAPLLAGGG